MSWRRVLLLAVGFAIWVGLAEEVWVYLISSGGNVVRLSRHFIWMTPLGNLFFFGVAGIALLLLGRVWSRAISRPMVTGGFVGLTVMALGLLLEGLHPGAVLLLAVGIGTQVGRRTGGPVRRPKVLLALTLGGALVVLGLTARAEWKRHVWEETWINWLPAPPSGAANVLLVILDTVRGASLDFMDDLGPMSEWPPIHPPSLDALAERAVVFTRAMAPAPWTFPSHASMFTGRWPHELAAAERREVRWIQGMDPRFPTLAETLARNGYLTAGFVGNLVFTSAETGLVRGFLTYEDYTVSVPQILLSCALGRRLSSSDALRKILRSYEVLNRKDAEKVADQFLAWHAREGNRPFFAFLNFFDAHEPYPVSDSVKRALPSGSEWNDFSHSSGLFTSTLAWRNEKWTMDPAERQAFVKGYDEGILRADRALGRVLEELDRRGALGNTVVIVAGDHGEQLGEHGLFHHNNSLYLPLLHVPFLILDPREEPSVLRVPDVVSLRNLAATILDLVGVDSEAAGIDGHSLVPHWREVPEGAGLLGTDPASGPGPVSKTIAPSFQGAGLVLAVLDQWGDQQPWYPAVRGPTMYSLTDSTHHYIFNGDGTEELYDFGSDPGELRNLAQEPQAKPVLDLFRATLRAVVENLPPVDEGPVAPSRAPEPPGGRS